MICIFVVSESRRIHDPKWNTFSKEKKDIVIPVDMEEPRIAEGVDLDDCTGK